MNEKDLSDAELIAAVREGLRIYDEQCRREWEAMSFWEKLGDLRDDMPWLGKLVLFGVLPLAFLLGIVAIVMTVMGL